MSPTTSTVTLSPRLCSLLAKTGSVSTDVSAAITAAKTAQLWDECERMALENERRRNGTTQTLKPQRKSSSDISNGQASRSASTQKSMPSDSDISFREMRMAKSLPASALCRKCKQTTLSASQTCEACQNIDLARAWSEATSLSGPRPCALATTDLLKPRENPSTSISIEQAPFFPSPPRPPLTHKMYIESSQSRKTSLTDPNEAFLRSQIASHHAQALHSPSHPTNSTINSASSLNSSAPYSRCSTRPSSFANRYSYHRNNSATPSEMSTLYSYGLTNTTSPLSLSSVDYALQNIKSAWDDWDSDEEREKQRVTSGTWMRRKVVKSKEIREEKEGKETKERMDSVITLNLPKKKSKKKSQDERLEDARRETLEQIRACKIRNEKKKQQQQQQPQKRPRQRQPSTGLFKLVSCGCVKNN